MAFLVAASANAAETAPTPEPDGYRIEDLRAPTPATLAGAEVIDTARAAELWRAAAALFVDVHPRPEKPEGLAPGTLWRDIRRSGVPGGAWLPKAGYGALDAESEAAFRDSLLELAHGDRQKRIVFYCLRACWLSWNAAKRALALGFTRVAWYPEGTDGWTEAGLPTAPSAPYVGPSSPAR